MRIREVNRGDARPQLTVSQFTVEQTGSGKLCGVMRTSRKVSLLDEAVFAIAGRFWSVDRGEVRLRDGCCCGDGTGLKKCTAVGFHWLDLGFRM
jgi:hypothetical protein